MTRNKLAIIGGSGLYDVEEFIDRGIRFEYTLGQASDQILKTIYNKKEVYFYQDMEEDILFHLLLTLEQILML